MGKSVMHGTPSYEQIAFLDGKVAKLEAEVERFRKAIAIYSREEVGGIEWENDDHAVREFLKWADFED